MTEYAALISTDEEENIQSIPIIYSTYKRRWFYLFVVCLV